MSPNFLYSIFLFSLLHFVYSSADLSTRDRLMFDFIRNLTASSSRGTRIRPVTHEHEAVDVQAGMGINHLAEVDEHRQTVSVRGHISMYWTNPERVKWDRTAYNNTGWLTVTEPDMKRRILRALWVPDLEVINGLVLRKHSRHEQGLPAYIGVSSGGSVMLVSRFDREVTCEMDFRSWPYDEQICPIVLASWAYSAAEVNIKPNYRGNLPVRRGSPVGPSSDKIVLSGWHIPTTDRNVAYDDNMEPVAHCYVDWAHTSCNKNINDTDGPSSVQSTVIHHIRLIRHTPLMWLLMITPIAISTTISQMLLLVRSSARVLHVPMILALGNCAMMAVVGVTAIKSMPPADPVPFFLYIIGFSIYSSLISLLLQIVSSSIQQRLPDYVVSVLPNAVENWLYKTKGYSVYKSEIMSFDPNTLRVGGLVPSESSITDLADVKTMEPETTKVVDQLRSLKIGDLLAFVIRTIFLSHAILILYLTIHMGVIILTHFNLE